MYEYSSEFGIEDESKYLISFYINHVLKRYYFGYIGLNKICY